MRRRLLLLLLAALVPLILLSAGLAWLLLSQRQQGMREEAQAVSDEVIEHVDQELTANIQLLQMLSETPILDGDNPDLARFHDLASRFIGRLPLWDRIILNSREGLQIVNTILPFGSPLPRTVVPEESEQVFRTGKPFIGNVSGPGPLAADGLPRAKLRVPVSREGKVRFDLTVVMSIAGFSDLLTSKVANADWRPFLVDGNGVVVAAPKAPQTIGKKAGNAALVARAAGATGLYAGSTPNGAPVMTAYSKSAVTGWSAHVSIPLPIYEAPIRRAYTAVTLAALAAAGLTLAFGFLARREIANSRLQAAFDERSARLEALGRITGGVAHDVNNVLMVVLSGIELVRKRTVGAGVDRYLDAMREAVERGTAVTRELLVFSRGSPRDMKRLDLRKHLQGISTILRQSLRGDIRFELVPGSTPAFVEVDVTHLDLALLNMAANSRDAMPDGGTFTISIGLAEFPDRSGRSGVLVEVSDTGSGISPDVLPRVFEPFFTTKEIAKGTGLGLSQVYGFAKASGGVVDIRSEVGRGTSVAVYLPVASAPDADANTAADEADRARTSREGRVLLVDDNAHVRSVTAEHLADFGYQVSQAVNADAALDLLGRDRPDVLVTDLVMPGAMDGLQLAREARRRWPELPIVLVSGYSKWADAARAEGFPLVSKPYDVADLSDVIDSARAGLAVGNAGQFAK